MKRKLLPLLVVSALSLGIGVATLTGCDVSVDKDTGPDYGSVVEGVTITSIVKTGSEGLVDTYTITYSNGKTAQFTVTNGKDGETGATGSQGPQGVKGEDGHTPIITISENGTWVIDGVDSKVSATGVKGDTGETGPQGPKGDTGETGPQGPKGPKGESGSSFLSGATNPTEATGRDGDTYMNYLTGDVFVKSEGTWTKVSNLRGNDGSSFLTGEEDPTDATGRDGDAYLNLTTNDLFIRVNGSWVLKGNIKGDKGDVGPHVHTFDAFGLVDDADEVHLDIVKKCLFCDELETSAIINQMEKKVYGSVELSDSKSPSNYTFTKDDDGWYTSTNHKVKSSSSYIYFKVKKSGLIKVEYNVSSESKSYDYLTGGFVGQSPEVKEGGCVTNDATDVGISGTLELEVKAGDEIYFQYTKDSSGDKGRDEAKIKIVAGEPTYNMLTFANIEGIQEEAPTPLFIENGTILGSVPTVSKENDTQYFDGWKIDPELNTPLESSGLVGDIVAYASWADPVYITTDLNYTGQPEEKVKYKYKPGVVPTVGGSAGIASPTREGYYFLGWYEDADLSIAYTPVSIMGDKTIYAKWISETDVHALYGTYSGVRFNDSVSYLNTSYANLTVGVEGEYKLQTNYNGFETGTIEETTREGTTQYETSGISDIYDCGDFLLVCQDKTFAKNKYVYILGKGEAISSSGSTLKHLNVGGNSSGISIAQFAVKGTSHTVVIDRTGTTPSVIIDASLETLDGTPITLSSSIDQTNLVINIVKNNETLRTLYANGTESSDGYGTSTYTLKYGTTNDGTAGTYTNSDASISLSGAGQLLFTNLPNVSGGKTSVTSVSSSAKYTVDSEDPNVVYISYSSNVKLKVTLDKNTGTFTSELWASTVTFDLNYVPDGESESKKITANKVNGNTLWLSSVKDENNVSVDNVTREGYIFDGWYKNPECTGSAVTSSITTEGNQTLYAKWVLPVTITLHLNNGGEDVVVSGKPGSYCTDVTAPTKEGFKFENWYTDEECTEVWDHNYGTTNIELYANYLSTMDYSSLVGEYKGANIYGSNKNTVRSSSYNLKVEESGSFSGRGSGTLSEAIMNENGQITLKDGKKMARATADDGREILVTHYKGPDSSFVATDVALQVKVAANEDVKFTQTSLINNIWAVECIVTNTETREETTYNVLVDAVKQVLVADVEFVVNGDTSPLSAIYASDKYADSVVIKKGETTLYSFVGGSSLSTAA